jgi:hypothetical protein
VVSIARSRLFPACLTTRFWATKPSPGIPLDYFFLHASNIFLLLALALRLTHALRTSFFVATLWAIHPVTESVTNIVGRADLVAGFAVLAGFLLYLNGIRPRALIGLAILTAIATLADLHSRVHRGAYQAQPSWRVYIPKADGRRRRLGIAALEDKIVQQAVVTILNEIYEVNFKGYSRTKRWMRWQWESRGSA